jgi:hypothetical protein
MPWFQITQILEVPDRERRSRVMGRRQDIQRQFSHVEYGYKSERQGQHRQWQMELHEENYLCQILAALHMNSSLTSVRRSRSRKMARQGDLVNTTSGDDSGKRKQQHRVAATFKLTSGIKDWNGET